MSETTQRITTTLEIDCPFCNSGWWEAEGYADFPLWDVFPEFVDQDDAECPSCEAVLYPRRESDVAGYMTSKWNRALLQAEAKGIQRYAYWKDGEQYVGSTGTKLEDAIAELEQRRKS